MSSDFISIEEDPFYSQHNPQSNPITMFNSDPFSNFSESSIDSILLEFSEEPNAIATSEIHNNFTEAQSLDQLAQTLMSDSSPVHQMENLSLYQPTQFTNFQNSSDFPNGFVHCPVSQIGVKLEDTPFQMGFDSSPSSNAYFSGSDSYGGESSVISFLQRSFSHGSHLYDEQKQGSLFQPEFPALSTESSVTSFFNEQFGGQIRRVLSTGDLPKKATQREYSSNLGNHSTTTFMEETSFKVGRYSPEERKEKIDRYRAKRSLRNFNKTIKYACRKTLADSRPRVRGRFARSDEPVEMAKSAPCLNRYEDEDDLWVEGVHDQRGQFVNQYGSSFQFDHEFIGY